MTSGCSRRRASAEKRAQGLQLAPPSAVAAEVRWAFTPPRWWLSGVAANLVLALVWLLVQLAHLVLPYALSSAADPTGGIEHDFFWSQVPRAVAPILGSDSRSFVHIGIAAAVWA